MRKAEDIIIVECVFYVDGDDLKCKLEEYKNEYKGSIKIAKSGIIKIVKNNKQIKYIPEGKVNSYEVHPFGKSEIMVFDSEYNKDTCLNNFLIIGKTNIEREIDFKEVLLKSINNQLIMNYDIN